MDWNALRRRWQEWLKQPGARQRLIWIGTAAAVMAVAIAVAAALNRPGYAPLFRELDPQDAADIVARLEEQGVPYRLAEGGRTVLVPEDELHRLRLELAADGIPSGGVVGLEILDRFQFGATEFERRMNYLRALQGELTRTIRQIDAVADARVHIVVPEERLFISQQQPATAAVLVNLKPGHTLTREQVAAITRLVAGSVEGLKPEDVTVVDGRGTVLTPAGDEETAAAQGSWQNLEVQQRFQDQLESSVQSLLEQVFGPGNVITRVSAELNFDQSVIERELFEPADPEGLLRSVQELEEEFTGTAAAAGGFPGTDSNIPLPTMPMNGAQDATYRRNERINNYELNEIRERLVIAPGTVRRLSVSVVINEPLSPEQVAAVRSTVEAAIGYDAARNDQITVIGMPFNTSVSEQLQAALAAEEQARQEQAERQLYVLAAGCALLLLTAAVAWWVRRRRAARQHQEEKLQERLEQLDLARQRLAAERAEANGRAADPERERAQRELETLVRQKPEQVAQIVRAWLAEE
ncbi:MAG TPA: flagellar basal-body MS-ring/collar protein FliF [Bacillota bacterium]